jgi:2-dehydropantoate 2-reductase
MWNSSICGDVAVRILILGAGGIGGYFGGQLIQAGADVTFLVREPRARQLETTGLVVESPLGDVRVSVRTAVDANSVAPADIVILACKAYDLAGALDSVDAAVRQGTVILPLLNGVAHLETIAARLPGADLWGGVAHLGVTLTRDGVVRHLNQLNNILFGPRRGRCDARSAKLLSLFAATSVEAKARDNIEQDLWDKFVFLATLAGMTCLMRANIGTILKTASGERLILQLLGECERVADAQGFRPNQSQLARYRAQLTQRGSVSTASMLRDIERAGPTECDHTLGDMAARARQLGVAAPLLEVALTHLQVYERQRVQAQR